MEEHLCKTCNNWFETNYPEYYKDTYGQWIHRQRDSRYDDGDFSCDEPTAKQKKQLVVESEFCVYTREHEEPATCTFYNQRQELAIITEPPKKVDTDDYDYQDVDRTFTTSERATSVRLDCRTKREGVPQINNN